MFELDAFDFDQHSEIVANSSERRYNISILVNMKSTNLKLRIIVANSSEKGITLAYW